MCSRKVGSVEADAWSEAVWADVLDPDLVAEHEVVDEVVWQQLVEDVRAQDEMSAWGRFAHLFTVDADELSRADGGPAIADGELLTRMRHCEALVTQLAVEQSRYLLELRRRRLTAQAGEHPHADGVCVSACCDDDGWVSMEVGQELGLSERQVQARIDTALRLERHPEVGAAMESGRLQAWTASRLLEHLSTLAAYVSPQRLAAVEAATVTWLVEQPRTVSALNARMRRLILAARAATRSDHADEDPSPDEAPGGGPIDGRRQVTVRPSSTPGLAELVAMLPETDALAIRATLYALAHDKADPDDPRSADQRRADLLVSLLCGRVASHGRPADSACAVRDPVDVQVRLDVTVSADTLTGSSSAPAWVAGYGDLPASSARALAAGGTGTTCAARPLVYHPATGHLVGFAATPVRMTWLSDLRPSRGYQHAPTLHAAVRLRDGTCRAPGCTRRAARCDCDHLVPYPRGETSLANSCSLCRRHHRLKTHAPGWTVTSEDTNGGVGGQITWTSPAGRRLTTYLSDYRPPDHELPPGGQPDQPDQPDEPPF